MDRTKKAAAISSSLLTFLRSARKARNWSSGCSGARWIFSARRILFREPAFAHDAGHRRGPGEPLPLDQQLERPVAATAGGNFEHAGLVPLGVEDRPDVQSLDQAAPRDVFRQFLDRDAGLDTADVRLLDTSLLKGMSREGAKAIFWAAAIFFTPRRAAENSLSAFDPSRRRSAALSLLEDDAARKTRIRRRGTGSAR